jgi:hypothetical protein
MIPGFWQLEVTVPPASLTVCPAGTGRTADGAARQRPDSESPWHWHGRVAPGPSQPEKRQWLPRWPNCQVIQASLSLPVAPQVPVVTVTVRVTVTVSRGLGLLGAAASLSDEEFSDCSVGLPETLLYVC